MEASFSNFAAERYILGAMTLETEAAETAVLRLRPESFTDPDCRTIFLAMRRLVEQGREIDLASLRDALGGSYTKVLPVVSDIFTAATTAANLEYHVELLTKAEQLRTLDAGLIEARRLIFEGSEQAIDVAKDAVKRAQAFISADIKPDTFSGLLDKILHDEKAIPTPFKKLNAVTGGFKSKQLVVVGGSTGAGKSSFACTIAGNFLLKGKTVVYASLEMDAAQIQTRIAYQLSSTNEELVRRDVSAQDRFKDALSRLDRTKAFTLDRISSVDSLRSSCRKIKQSVGSLDLVVVDYVQLIGDNSKTANREQQVSAISHALKRLAVELDTIVLALAQLNRGPDTREGANKEPRRSDLRESAALEQDADLILLLYQPYLYGLGLDGRDPNPEAARLILAKNRFGKCGRIDVRWLGEFFRYQDWDAVEYEPGQATFTDDPDCPFEG